MSKTDEAAPSKPVLQINNMTSLLDLKTEFIKRKKAATDQVNLHRDMDVVNRTKSTLLAVNKEEKKRKEEERELRSHRIKNNAEAIQKEEQEYNKRQKILAEKAKIYEQMTQQGSLVYQDGKEAEFLVNFEEKRREIQEKQDFKANSTYNHKDFRSEDEGKKEEPVAPLIVHYDPSEEPGRVFGASHVPLSVVDEEKRQAQIADLKRLTEETNTNRLKQKNKMNTQKELTRKRINRLREQKGLPPLPSSDDELETSRECAEQPVDPAIADIPLPEGNAAEMAKEEPLKVKKARYGVREWDRGKTGYKKWISKEREDRNEEFQPPSFYYE